MPSFQICSSMQLLLKSSMQSGAGLCQGTWSKSHLSDGMLYFLLLFESHGSGHLHL